MSDEKTFTGQTWKNAVREVENARAKEDDEGVNKLSGVCIQAMKQAASHGNLEAAVDITHVKPSIVAVIQKYFATLMDPIQSKITEVEETRTGQKDGDYQVKITYLVFSPA